MLISGSGNIYKAIRNMLSSASERMLRLVHPDPVVAFERTAILSVHLTLTGIVCWLLHRLSFFHAHKLSALWNDGLVIPSGAYNIALVDYVTVVGSLFGGLAFVWLSEAFPRLRAYLGSLASEYRLLVAAVALVGVAGLTVPFARICFGLAIIISLPYIQHCMRNNVPLELPRWFTTWSRNWLLLLPFGVLLLAAGIATQAWYPVSLPNDYIEIEDEVRLSQANANMATPKAYVPRITALNCLEADKLKRRAQSAYDGTDVNPKELQSFINSLVTSPAANGDKGRMPEQPQPECPTKISANDINLLKGTISQTGQWQSQAGRLLYHHSFMFVPAQHALTYGVLSNNAYLYGFGNTLFHAGLMRATSQTLTGYFNTYPVAQATGLLCIIFLVFYITRSFLASLLAGGVMLMAFLQISYEFIFLPPGFNPLRYVGLAAQVASIFCLHRGASSWRYVLLVSSAAFSVLWNAEFALIGLVGQALAVLSPHYAVSGIGRIIRLFILGLVAGCFWMFYTHLTHGYLQGVGLGFFGVFPIISLGALVLFCVGAATATIIILATLKHFSASEQAARLSVLPIYALLLSKYLLYANPEHLCFTLIFIGPLLVTHITWQRTVSSAVSSIDGEQKRQCLFILVCAVAMITFIKSFNYHADAVRFRGAMIEPYRLHQWTELGESLPTAIPQLPIKSRIDAIRAELSPDDTVLYLSPFDHLLAFYTNPKDFCGHFEILVNPITSPMVDAITACARSRNPVLIVYDAADHVACPDGWMAKYYDRPSCRVKFMLKQNAAAILEAVRDKFHIVKKVGDLTFYRNNP